MQGFGPGSLIPSPFDPRLILRIAPAVAKAAMKSGVATRPIARFEDYTAQLERFAFRSGLVMKPVFAKAKTQPVRVIYAEGEDERVLHATQVVLEEKLARPILVGRPSVVEARIKRFGLAIKAGQDFDLINPEDDPRYRSYVQSYIDVAGRTASPPDAARTVVRTNATVIAALAVVRGEADAMICGVEGSYMSHLRHVREIIGFMPGISDFAALALMITSKGAYFIADTQVRPNPSAEELAEMRRWRRSMSSASISNPKSHSCRIRILAVTTPSPRENAPRLRAVEAESSEIEADGEMQGDTALRKPLEADPAAFEPGRRCQHPDHAEPRYRQRRLPDDQGTGRCAAGRAHPDWAVASGAHPYALGDCAWRSQHDGGGRRRSPGACRPPATDLVWLRSMRSRSGPAAIGCDRLTV